MAEGLNQMIAMHGRGLNLDPAGQLQRGVNTMAGMQDLQMQPLRKKEAELRLAALEQENQASTDEFKIRDLATDAIKIKPLLESGDLTRANTMIAERIQKIMQRGGDPADTMAFRDALNSKQITPQQAAAELGMEIEAAKQAGVFRRGMHTPAGQQQFNSLLEMLRPAMDANGQIDPSKLTAEQRAAANELGLTAKVGTMTGAERIATTPGMTAPVAQSQATIKAAEAGAAEGAKLGQQAALMPNIRKSIKLAESEATAKGETFTELSRAKAAMPGLVEVSDKLKALSDVATYTTTGKAFDLMSKELGFGSTKGADARTAMVSIVDNQVLPLLRDTFGAAFTAAEGERLRATLLDVDMAPDQKKASLDAFVEQKYRNMETKERELGMPITPRPGGQQPAQGGKQGGQIMIDANGNRAMVYPDGSFEEMP
jgi:hypothetical protein